MKLIRMITILLFSAMILVPVAAFNFEENSISLIDNRELTENPFFPRNVGKWGSDRKYRKLCK